MPGGLPNFRALEGHGFSSKNSRPRQEPVKQVMADDKSSMYSDSTMADEKANAQTNTSSSSRFSGLKEGKTSTT